MPAKSPASFDLHLHTCWSYDAVIQPELYFQQAEKLGVRCLAITEHHSIESLEEVTALAARYPGIRVIPAAELTVSTSIGNVDLLCYNLPPQPTGLLAEVLEEYHQWQRKAGAARCLGMQALGFPHTEADRIELLGKYRPARVLAKQGATAALVTAEKRHFVERGYITSDEGYAALARNWPREHKRPPFPSVDRVTQAVKAAGGLVVIAHPTAYFCRDDLERMDALRIECRLDGIECAHRKVPPELTEFYRTYCLRHGLLSTAGSDCHNTDEVVNPPAEWGHTTLRRFAAHLGQDKWLEEFLARLDKTLWVKPFGP